MALPNHVEGKKILFSFNLHRSKHVGKISIFEINISIWGQKNIDLLDDLYLKL